MSSLTEKISVKDFNNFFKNDQTSRGKHLNNLIVINCFIFVSI